MMGEKEQTAASESEAGEKSGAHHLPELTFLDVAKLHFEKPGPDTPVRVTVEGDRSYLRVSARAAFPLTDRVSYIELYDGADKQIGMIRSMESLPSEQRAVLQTEIDRRYFTPTITAILSVKREFGSYTWDVVTDRGEMTFTVRSIREDIDLLANDRFRIKDIEGRFYEVPDAKRLPATSRKIFWELL